MTIAIERRFKPLTQLVLTNRQLMREIGLQARETIIKRTLSGTDQDGRSFRPYSPGYAKTKQRHLGKSQVDLQASGAMLNAIVLVDVTDDSVTLGFSS